MRMGLQNWHMELYHQFCWLNHFHPHDLIFRTSYVFWMDLHILISRYSGPKVAVQVAKGRTKQPCHTFLSSRAKVSVSLKSSKIHGLSMFILVFPIKRRGFVGLLHFWTNPNDSASNVLSPPVAWTSQADRPDLFFQHFQPSPVVNNG